MKGNTNNSQHQRRERGRYCWLLLLSNLLIFQLGWTLPTLLKETANKQQQQTQTLVDSMYLSSSHEGSASEQQTWQSILLQQNPLGIPPGQAQNLPSIRQSDPNLEKKRSIYGGAGDKKHLGGFTEIDLSGISPTLWTHMLQDYGVHSFLDVGCGRGISTLWFLEHGADVLCVEGSHDAVQQSFLPPDRIVEHDFARGPWWPNQTYDAVWSVEFLEHVSRQYHFNYMQVFRKAALIFVTSSRWGGWHHVEVHGDSWWIRKFESYGFRYDESLTNQVKSWARDERTNSTLKPPNGGGGYSASHVITSMKVFVNPMVAALPQHAHLFPHDGCFQSYNPKGRKYPAITRPCGVGRHGGMETPLPASFEPLEATPEQYKRWFKTIQQGIPQQLAKHNATSTVTANVVENATTTAS